MTKFLCAIGVSTPMVIGFALSVLISSLVADKVVHFFYQKLLCHLVKQDPKVPPEQIEAKRQTVLLELELGFARIIGRCERVFYIYAVMSGAFAVLSSWVILKAFYGWIDRPEARQHLFAFAEDATTKKEAHKLVTYYLYIFGNGLSLMAGIALGHLGLVTAQTIKYFAGVV